MNLNAVCYCKKKQFKSRQQMRGFLVGVFRLKFFKVINLANVSSRRRRKGDVISQEEQFCTYQSRGLQNHLADHYHWDGCFPVTSGHCALSLVFESWRWYLTAPAWIKFLGLHGPAMEFPVSHQGRFKPGRQRSLRMQTADSCSAHANWREICPHLNCSH